MDTTTQTPPVASSDLVQLSCGPDCGHTAAEHTAFDQGVRDGAEFRDENPYRSPLLRFAWDSGHSVGVLNRGDKLNDSSSATPSRVGGAYETKA